VNHLFVYGTLRRGAGAMCARFLSDSTFVGAGRVAGRIFRLDGYPGMVACTEGSAQVVGEVFRLYDPLLDLPLLDEYEGCGPADPLPHEFERGITPVQMDDGRTLDAWVYLYRLDTSGRAPIPSGDYLEPRSS
jgi:gamma-glutamylcyclotransferase (GGCT)/AIG2-like uncharacterized protein YtfP